MYSLIITLTHGVRLFLPCSCFVSNHFTFFIPIISFQGALKPHLAICVEPKEEEKSARWKNILCIQSIYQCLVVNLIFFIFVYFPPSIQFPASAIPLSSPFIRSFHFIPSQPCLLRSHLYFFFFYYRKYFSRRYR